MAETGVAKLELDVTQWNQAIAQAQTGLSGLSGTIIKASQAVGALGFGIRGLNTLMSKATWKQFRRGLVNVREAIGKLPRSAKIAAVALVGIGVASFAALKAVQALRRSITGLSRQLAGSLRVGLKVSTAALAALAAGVVVVSGVMAKGLKDAVAYGDAVFRASVRAGVEGAGNYALLERALVNSGLSASMAQSKIRQFQQEGRDFAELFKSPEDFKAAMAGAADSLGSNAGVLNRSAEKFTMVVNMMRDAGETVRGFFLSAAEQVLPPLLVVLEALQQIDLGAAGERFGKSLRQGAEVLIGLFRENTIGEAVKLGLVVAAKEFGNLFTRTLLAAGNGFVQAIAGGLKATFDSLKDILIGVAQVFAGTILEKLEPVLSLIPGFEGTGDLGGALQRSGAALGTRGAEGIDAIGPSIEKGFKGGVNAFSGFSLFGTEQEKAQLSRIFEKAGEVGREFVEASGIMEKTLPKLNFDFNTEGGGSPLTAGGRGREIIADSLASVGGGGRAAIISGDPILDINKQQLDAQRNSLAAQKKIISVLEAGSSGGGGVVIS